MSAHEYQNQYQKKLKKLNNEEFIEVFNRSLHTAPCYGVIIQAHQGALLNEFERREIDYSTICNGNSVPFSKKVKLEGNHLLLPDSTALPYHPQQRSAIGLP